ncbi:MAG: hypothetical protein Fur0037_19160 [Planctomycetota bacterium]
MIPFLLVSLLLSHAIVAQHPQAVTDCGDCHLDPYTGTPELHYVHSYNCNWCHPDYDFSRTILGPVGNWNHECSGCHNPDVIETGNRPVPTKGHRCIVCHGTQMPTANPEAFHERHAKRADCTVCHGFVPDIGTSIGSGNRAGCATCHEHPRTGTSIREIHRRMTREGVSCLECHGGARPPVDVVPGPVVGSSSVVCDICHTGADPAQFRTRGAELHKEHIEKKIACGSCHSDANLQDDSIPMPAHDDARRALLDRAGTNECAHCHDRPVSATIPEVHERHVSGKKQWCFDCHEGSDLRPLGLWGPVTSPSQSCALCHGALRSYADDMPFDVHEDHASAAKCQACHQGNPPLSAWPDRWGRDPGTFRAIGSACPGSNQQSPRIGHATAPRIGNPLAVTLSSAPASTAAVMLIGFETVVLPLATEGMPGCTLYPYPVLNALSLTDPAGSGSFQLPIPNDRDLIGVPLYFQWLVVDAAANPRGATLSDGGLAVFGR